MYPVRVSAAQTIVPETSDEVGCARESTKIGSRWSEYETDLGRSNGLRPYTRLDRLPLLLLRRLLFTLGFCCDAVLQLANSAAPVAALLPQQFRPGVARHERLLTHLLLTLTARSSF